MRSSARLAERSRDGTPLDCSIETFDGWPSREISNVTYTRFASAMRGSTSYFNQFSVTFLCTPCTYHENRLPKSPPLPVNPKPPLVLPAVMLYGPLTGPPSPYGTSLVTGGSSCALRFVSVFTGAGFTLVFTSLSGIGIASGSTSGTTGSDFVSPFDSVATTFLASVGLAGKGTELT